MSESETLSDLLARVRACRVCEAHLPLGPRPVLRATSTARVMIVGQAPGTKVHETGVPWDDPSGDHLREWLDLDRAAFYDESRIAIVPTGFCYPGRNPKGGDMPPRPECAPLWHPLLLPHMPELALTLLVGGSAQDHYLGRRRGRNVTETVRAWREYLPAYLPTPHPSWRSRNWLKRNPWFAAEVVPVLRAAMERLL